MEIPLGVPQKIGTYFLKTCQSDGFKSEGRKNQKLNFAFNQQHNINEDIDLKKFSSDKGSEIIRKHRHPVAPSGRRIRFPFRYIKGPKK